jgi:hypothetical protein
VEWIHTGENCVTVKKYNTYVILKVDMSSMVEERRNQFEISFFASDMKRSLTPLRVVV